MTNILLILLIGSFIGFFYALSGGGSLASFPNSDGRPIEFYLTTLSIFTVGNFIRPSAVFDEPGTFSFFICFIAAARHVMNLPRKKTWILLMGGLITLSLAHVLYFIFHVLSEKLLSKSALVSVLVIPFFVLIALQNTEVYEAVDVLFFERFSVIDGKVSGYNRTDLFLNALDNLNPRSLIFGVNSTCVTDYSGCVAQYGVMSENPLGPIAYTGILGSIPYYLLTAWFFLWGIKRKDHFVFIGLAFLLLQRPYVMYYGYALLIYFVFYLRNICIIPRQSES